MPPSAGGSWVTRWISEASAAGGSKVIGAWVIPQSSESPIWGCTAKGGPMGSTATIALTRSGRASAISQPAGPPRECVMRIAGPIRSSSSAPRD